MTWRRWVDLPEPKDKVPVKEQIEEKQAELGEAVGALEEDVKQIKRTSGAMNRMLDDALKSMDRKKK